MQAIEEIQRHAQKIASGEHDTIRPGMPFRIPESWIVNEAVAQGDLVIRVIEEIRPGYELVSKPTKVDKQLVPGNTEGAKHCLDSVRGLKLYRPSGWPQSADGSLQGPIIVADRDVVIEHPKHGHVTIPKGRMVACDYDKEFDLIQKRERRNAD